MRIREVGLAGSTRAASPHPNPVRSVNVSGSFVQHDPSHGALIMFAYIGIRRDLADGMCSAAVLVLRMLR